MSLIALSFAPPAVVGYLLERPIERRLGTPATIAAGLLAGSAAMVAADRLGATSRRREDAGAIDGLALGVAQAVSLMPGVSRNGATLAAARARGFNRADANVLSRHVALPIIVGASALKGARLLARLRAGERGSAGSLPALAVGRARGVRLDPRLDVADPPGRARSLARTVRRLPHAPGGPHDPASARSMRQHAA